jgi:hypothetical protein
VAVGTATCCSSSAASCLILSLGGFCCSSLSACSVRCRLAACSCMSSGLMGPKTSAHRSALATSLSMPLSSSDSVDMGPRASMLE